MESNPRRVRWPLSCTLSWDYWKIQDWSISGYRRHVDEMVWSESGKAACATQVPPGKSPQKTLKRDPMFWKRVPKSDMNILKQEFCKRRTPRKIQRFIPNNTGFLLPTLISRGTSGPIFRPRWVKMTKNYFSKSWGQTNFNEGSYDCVWTNLQKMVISVTFSHFFAHNSAQLGQNDQFYFLNSEAKPIQTRGHLSVWINLQKMVFLRSQNGSLGPKNAKNDFLPKMNKQSRRKTRKGMDDELNAMK